MLYSDRACFAKKKGHATSKSYLGLWVTEKNKLYKKTSTLWFFPLRGDQSFVC